MLSWLSDTPTFYDDLSLWEHLEYVARLHGVDDWQPRAEELLEQIGLTARRDDIPTTFSRGLRQKAAITLAFVRPFELMLVDEPFVGLDEPGKQALLELFDAASPTRGDAGGRHPRAELRQAGRPPAGPARRWVGVRRSARPTPTCTPSCCRVEPRADRSRHQPLT